MDKLLIVDGNSIINRAFYGTENSFMKNAEGLYTGAIYGFINIILKYIEEDKPDYVAVAFDLPGKTFRHIEYEGYKATRKGMPEELRAQFPYAKDLLRAMDIAVVEREGYEADDILGSFAKLASSKQIDTIILTGDRDSLQLVDENVKVKLPVTRKGTTSYEFYDIAAIYEKYGIKPSQLIEVKALMGDKSDNIPGVMGVGEKTALALIHDYGNLDGVYENIDQITKPALKMRLEEGKDDAYLSRKLGTIYRDLTFEIDKDSSRNKNYDKANLFQLLNKLEFQSIIKRLKLEDVKADDIACETITLDSLEKIRAFAKPKDILKAYISYQLDGDNLFEISFRFDKEDKAYRVLIPGAIYINDFLASFSYIFEDEKVKKILYDAKALILWLMKNGVVFRNLYCDIKLAQYLSDSTRKSETISDAYRFYTSNDLLNGDNNGIFALRVLEDYAFARIKEEGQDYLYNEVEIPLVTILADLEYLGFKVNPDILKYEGKLFEKRLNELTEDILNYAGRDFNINSPKQLGEVLFDDLKLEGGKKTKTGSYQTNIEVLEKLTGAHPIIPLIIEYRQNAKLKSTYIDGLLDAIDPVTKRVHSSFNQTTTATGRLSSTEPNLQNLPIRSEIGRHIRRAFEPKDDDHILIDADYSQIELRVLAHISQDQAMIETFKNNEDIHRSTASRVFNVPLDLVNDEMRFRAKAVNFGIIYGISEFGLSRDLNISFYESKQIITEYLLKYPGVARYMKEIVESAEEKGYVETLLARRRYLPELSATKGQIKAFGKRMALNTPIQGSAADIIKIAMVKVYNELKARGLESKIILQVHDEILIDSLKSEEEEVVEILKDCMENALELSVPLVVTLSRGMNFDFE